MPVERMNVPTQGRQDVQPLIVGMGVSSGGLEGLRQFREHLGGELCVTLPDGLGAKTEVHAMQEPLLERAVAALRERYA